MDITKNIPWIILFLLIASSIIYNETKQNHITGNDVITTVEIVEALPSPCVFNLTEGWNMVSFYCLGLFSPRDTVLESINNSYDMIFAYDASDSSDHWKSYNPHLPSWAVQQLNYMDRLSGYWIYMNTSGEFIYNGSVRSSIIPLRPGWNLIGYPRTISSNITIALQNISYTTVKVYNSSTGSFQIYINGSSNNTLLVLHTYSGYWINSTASQNLLT